MSLRTLAEIEKINDEALAEALAASIRSHNNAFDNERKFDLETAAAIAASEADAVKRSMSSLDDRGEFKPNHAAPAAHIEEFKPKATIAASPVPPIALATEIEHRNYEVRIRQWVDQRIDMNLSNRTAELRTELERSEPTPKIATEEEKEKALQAAEKDNEFKLAELRRQVDEANLAKDAVEKKRTALWAKATKCITESDANYPPFHMTLLPLTSPKIPLAKRYLRCRTTAEALIDATADEKWDEKKIHTLELTLDMQIAEKDKYKLIFEVAQAEELRAKTAADAAVRLAEETERLTREKSFRHFYATKSAICSDELKHDRRFLDSLSPRDVTGIKLIAQHERCEKFARALGETAIDNREPFDRARLSELSLQLDTQMNVKDEIKANLLKQQAKNAEAERKVAEEKRQAQAKEEASLLAKRKAEFEKEQNKQLEKIQKLVAEETSRLEREEKQRAELKLIAENIIAAECKRFPDHSSKLPLSSLSPLQKYKLALEDKNQRCMRSAIVLRDSATDTKYPIDRLRGFRDTLLNLTIADRDQYEVQIKKYELTTQAKTLLAAEAKHQPLSFLSELDLMHRNDVIEKNEICKRMATELQKAISDENYPIKDLHRIVQDLSLTISHRDDYEARLIDQRQAEIQAKINAATQAFLIAQRAVDANRLAAAKEKRQAEVGAVKALAEANALRRGFAAGMLEQQQVVYKLEAKTVSQRQTTTRTVIISPLSTTDETVWELTRDAEKSKSTSTSSPAKPLTFEQEQLNHFSEIQKEITRLAAADLLAKQKSRLEEFRKKQQEIMFTEEMRIENLRAANKPTGTGIQDNVWKREAETKKNVAENKDRIDKFNSRPLDTNKERARFRTGLFVKTLENDFRERKEDRVITNSDLDAWLDDITPEDKISETEIYNAIRIKSKRS